MHHYAEKPTTLHDSVSVGDVVIVYDEDNPRIFWKLAKVEGLLKESDEIVRGAKVHVWSGNSFTVIKRPCFLLKSMWVMQFFLKMSI